MSDPPRLSLAKAEALAEKVMEVLRPVCTRIEVAGSIRRGVAEVGDLDLVCLPKPGQQGALGLLFRSCAQPGGLLLDGGMAKRCLLRKSGVQCDLWVAHHGIMDLIAPLPCNYGAMLLTYTGSLAHNIQLVQRAKKMGLTFKPGHGVVESTGRMHSFTEEEIFAALGMEWVPPEDR